MLIPEKGCNFDDWLNTRKAIVEFIKEQDFTADQAIEILKLKELESLNENIKDQSYQIERLNENLESVTGNFKGNAWINVSASVHEL
ncbi:MAG: hypothetical protein ACK5JH_11250 [Anaerocolumna sp.]